MKLAAGYMGSFLLWGALLANGASADQIPLGLLEAKKRIITDEFSTYVEGLLKEFHVKGLSLAVVKANAEANGDVEYGSWGDRTEDGDAVNPETLFSIGSCTKAFLATSLGLLIEDFATGKNVTPLPHSVTNFNWETKLIDLLPNEWKLRDKWANEKANIRDILSHVSGLVGQDLAYGPFDKEEDIVSRLRYLNTPTELRQQSSYNNAMYITASRLLRVYSKRTFHEFVRERIFEPLGMSQTTMSPTEAQESGLLSHSWAGPDEGENGQKKDGRRIPYWFSEETATMVAGAGGIISNAIDMAKWLDVLLHGGVLPTSNKTVIPKSVYDAVTTSYVIYNGRGTNGGRTSVKGYGMGWGRFSYRGHELITHTGGLPGFLSVVAFLPDAGLALVSLTNTDTGMFVNDQILLRIIEDYFGLDHPSDTGTNSPKSQVDSHSKSKHENREKPKFTGARLSLDDYAGEYVNPGYGNVTLCSSTSSSPSKHCKTVLHDFAIIDNASTHRGPQLLAHWPRVWASHFRLTPRFSTAAEGKDDRFSVEAVTLFPDGYGKDRTPWEYPHYDENDIVVDFIRRGSAVVPDGRESGGVESEAKLAGFHVCGIAGRLTEFEGLKEKCAAGKAEEGFLVWFEKLEE